MRRQRHRQSRKASGTSDELRNNTDYDSSEEKPASSQIHKRRAFAIWQPSRFYLLGIAAVSFIFCSQLCKYLWNDLRSRSAFQYQSDNRNDMAVFYHVFVPPNKGKKGVEDSLEVVREQIMQLYDIPERGKVSMFYTTTGVEHVAQEAVENLCQHTRLECHWMGHWNAGQEELTISRLYDYCQDNKASDVMYVHTKGTFHSGKGRNHAWRWHLTRAAVTCSSSLNLSHCDVCGLQFYPVWTTFFPGNMWTASCSYINRLWSPREFAKRLGVVVKNALSDERMTFTLFNASNPGNIGSGRYAMEHWVASHPSVRPCEIVTDSPSLEVWFDRNAAAVSAVTSAPQHPWEDDGWFRWNTSTVQGLIDSHNSRTEFFLLPGFLHKWKLLYNAVPPIDSWVWVWYPEGSFWKDRSYNANRTKAK